VVNEADPVNRPNTRGTLAMAWRNDPDSATSEWFFNLVNNTRLDDPNNSGGFTVSGKVLGDGMEVIDVIAVQLVVRIRQKMADPGPSGQSSAPVLANHG